MKKITIIGLTSLCAAGVYAQGTLNFNNQSSSSVSQVFAPNPAASSVEQLGNNAGQTPVGTTVYGGVAIGGSSGANPAVSPGAGGIVPTTSLNYAFGNQFTAQIYALGQDAGGGSANVPFSSLLPVTQYVTTLSVGAAGTTAGFIQAVSPTGDPGIPNAGYNSANGTIDNSASVALAAWYNAGGTITSLAAASAASVPYGFSATFADHNLGEPASVETAYAGAPTAGTTAGNMVGLRSFSLVTTSSVPEPSTIALGVMGVGAFLARRRKK